MKVLIKQAKIIDSSSEFNGEKKDVLIIDGKIADISNEIKSIDKKTFEISSNNIHLSKGHSSHTNKYSSSYADIETKETGSSRYA